MKVDLENNERLYLLKFVNKRILYGNGEDLTEKELTVLFELQYKLRDRK